ncbi:hypothetical protein GCM10027405_15060 [Arthrobacter alkaliphilus]
MFLIVVGCVLAGGDGMVPGVQPGTIVAGVIAGAASISALDALWRGL